MYHSSPISWPLSFDSGFNAGDLPGTSITWIWQGRCFDGMRVLSDCFDTLSKSTKWSRSQWLAVLPLQSNTKVGPYNLAWSGLQANFWVVLAHGNDTEGCCEGMVCECVERLFPKPQQVSNRSGYQWLASFPPQLLSKHSTSSSWPLAHRFVELGRESGQLLSGSVTWWQHGRCGGGIRVFWNCLFIPVKSSVGLSDNLWPWCHLNTPFFSHIWAS